MLLPLFSTWAIITAGVVTYVLGGLWYSPFLFMRWWLEGRNMTRESMPKRPKRYMWQVMIYTFLIGTIMCAILAFVIDLVKLDTLSQAVSMAVVLALGFIGLKNFSDMLYTMPDTFWSIRAQKKFFVDTAFYVCMFAIATLVMYYMQTWLGA